MIARRTLVWNGEQTLTIDGNNNSMNSLVRIHAVTEEKLVFHPLILVRPRHYLRHVCGEKTIQGATFTTQRAGIVPYRVRAIFYGHHSLHLDKKARPASRLGPYQ